MGYQRLNYADAEATSFDALACNLSTNRLRDAGVETGAVRKSKCGRGHGGRRLRDQRQWSAA
jgi:hypothetical protein